MELNLPGAHNVLNALAAIAVATELDVGDEAIRAALAGFEGIGRRLERVGEVNTARGRIDIVDDYGHHPTEIAATLEAVRQGWPGRRVVLAFQPHRYTRTQDLMDDFGQVLSEADVLLVTEVYAAGEQPIANADGRAVCRAVRSRGRVEPVFVEDVLTLAEPLADLIEDGDLVITMGAGNISAVAHELPARLRSGGARMTAIAVPHGLRATRARRDELMSRHTSWHVGGPADLWFVPRDLADLSAFLAQLAGGACR